MLTHQPRVWIAVVVNLFELVHPDLSRSHAVRQSFAPRVRCLFREHMTHVGARVYLQAAPTLPNLRNVDQQGSNVVSLCSCLLVICCWDDIR